VLSIHRSLLPDGNPLKQAAVNNGSGDYTVDLKDEVGEIYNVYVSSRRDGRLSYRSQESYQQDFLNLLIHHNFGDQMADETYQDYVMDALRLRMCRSKTDGSRPELPSLKHVLAMYCTIPAGSPLRKIATHLCAWAGIGKYLTLHDHPKLLHARFVADLVTELDNCIRQPQSYRTLQQTFSEGYPWPYFHTIEGTTEQLKSEEGTAMQPIEL
jgi:hypothetical protein